MTIEDTFRPKLRAASLFEDLTDEEIDRVCEVSRIEHFREGDLVIREGDALDKNIYVLLEGQVHAFIEGKTKRIVVAIIEDTGVFGELMSIFPSGKRVASIMANGESSILIIDDHRFKQLVRQETRIGMIIYRNLCRIIADKLIKTDILLRHTIEWGW